MHINQFKMQAIAILRSSTGWQSRIARLLGVNDRTVRRWLESGELPAWVDKKLAEIIGINEISPWPRDEWMVGDIRGPDDRYREYICHMQPPRFIARIVACDEDGTPRTIEQPADTETGIVHFIGSETILCEIAWIDMVDQIEALRWLEAAADYIENNQ